MRENALKKWMKHKKLQLKKKASENNLLYFIHEENDLTLFKIGFTTNLKDYVHCKLEMQDYLLFTKQSKTVL